MIFYMSIIESRRDIQMVGRAIRERWPIPEEARSKIVCKLLEIVISPESDARDINQAARVLASIDKMNLDLERAASMLSFEELKDEMRSRLMVMQQPEEEPDRLE